jgi:hypothetical protein
VKKQEIVWMMNKPLVFLDERKIERQKKVRKGKYDGWSWKKDLVDME